MEKVFFKPWVGRNYEKGFMGAKLLVLGASHYCDDQNESCLDCAKQCPNIINLTNEIMENEIIPYETSSYIKTFVGFERAIYNRSLEQHERESFWQSVIFYNFCQEPVGNWKKKPTNKMLVDSIPAFIELIKAFQPDCIIIWGEIVKNIITDENNINGLKKGPTVFVEGKHGGDLWEIEYSNNKRVLLCPIQHPSFGFSWENWHDFIISAIKKSKAS